MTTYLSMDGTDDYLEIPKIVIDQVVMDIEVKSVSAWSIYFEYLVSNGYLHRNGSNEDSWQSYWSSGYVDGTSVSNNTDFMPLDSRVTVNISANTIATNPYNLFVFANQLGSSPVGGNIYDIKLYNSGNVIAHYDMSTGTVKDQTGNGYDAINHDGTWVNTSTGNSGPESYDTKQIIYNNNSINNDIDLKIYNHDYIDYDTKQVIYDPKKTLVLQEDQIIDLNTPLSINKSFLVTNSASPMLSYVLGINSSGVVGSLKFDTKQLIYKVNNINYSVKQIIYNKNSISFDTFQKIWSPNKGLIGTIEMEGKRNLYIYMTVQLNEASQKGVI